MQTEFGRRVGMSWEATVRYMQGGDPIHKSYSVHSVSVMRKFDLGGIWRTVALTRQFKHHRRTESLSQIGLLIQ